jgi:hypothetical protein
MRTHLLPKVFPSDYQSLCTLNIPRGEKERFLSQGCPGISLLLVQTPPIMASCSLIKEANTRTNTIHAQNNLADISVFYLTRELLYLVASSQLSSQRLTERVQLIEGLYQEVIV